MRTGPEAAHASPSVRSLYFVVTPFEIHVHYNRISSSSSSSGSSSSDKRQQYFAFRGFRMLCSWRCGQLRKGRTRQEKKIGSASTPGCFIAVVASDRPEPSGDINTRGPPGLEHRRPKHNKTLAPHSSRMHVAREARPASHSFTSPVPPRYVVAALNGSAFFCLRACVAGLVVC